MLSPLTGSELTPGQKRSAFNAMLRNLTHHLHKRRIGSRAHHRAFLAITTALERDFFLVFSRGVVEALNVPSIVVPVAMLMPEAIILQFFCSLTLERRALTGCAISKRAATRCG